jgi:hypothetical protein
VDSMSGEEPYLEHIESAEIKKLIDRIYASKPEDAIPHDVPEVHHDQIAEEIDNLLIRPKEPTEQKGWFGRRHQD